MRQMEYHRHLLGDGENAEPNSPQKVKYSSRGNATSSPNRSALLPINSRNNNNGIEQDDDREEEENDVDETLLNFEDNNIQHNRPMIIDQILPCKNKNDEQRQSEEELIKRRTIIVFLV